MPKCATVRGGAATESAATARFGPSLALRALTPRYAFHLRRAATLAFCALLVSASAAQQLPELKFKPTPPEQPLPFSHQKHVGQGLACVECHSMPEPGDYAEITGSEKCMACHSSIKTDSPAIQRLTQFHKAGEDIPWKPVYRIADYVFFSHAVHVKQVGAECADCHGPVGERDVLGKERDISMAACMGCHRAKGGSLECDYCHDPR